MKLESLIFRSAGLAALARCAAAVAVALAASVCAGADARPAYALRGSLAAKAKGLEAANGAIPGCVLALGGDAVPLAFGRVGETECSVAAASVMGRGRVVAFGHDSFVSRADTAPNAEFVRECVSWLARGGKPDKVYVDYAAKRLGMAGAALAGATGVAEKDMKVVEGYDELATLPSGAFLVAFPDAHSLEESAMLSKFVKRGGNVICAVVGWGWSQITGGRSMSSENPFNAAFGVCGLFTANLAAKPTEGALFPAVGAEGLPGTIGDEALALMQKGGADAKALARCELLLESLFVTLPQGDARLMPRLRGLAKTPKSGPVPSPSKPFGAERAMDRFRLALHASEWQRNPGIVWPAHPAAAVYPGLPSAPEPRVSRTVEVDLSVPRWHGTGLFAGAGEPLAVEIPESAKGLGLRVRVGTTTCRNTHHATWLRAPEVSVELALDKTRMSFASPFGGMVYVVVPEESGLSGKVPVKFTHACPAAWYVEGRDTPESWKKALESSPSPVAEIESDAIVLTVPAAVARRAGGDPGEVLALWRRILELDAKLASVKFPRTSPERICYDVQLCAGYMHSGYPIMLPVKCMPLLLNVAAMKEGMIDEVWGCFHEMGHNHQSPDWTFSGSEEITVNIFSLYCMEKICGMKPAEVPQMRDPALLARVERWKAKGRPFDEWKSDAWLGIVFFAELQQKYGWEAFERLFAEYAALPEAERPKTDFDKRRQMCERLSRIVGKDLSDDFSFMLRN